MRPRQGSLPDCPQDPNKFTFSRVLFWLLVLGVRQRASPGGLPEKQTQGQQRKEKVRQQKRWQSIPEACWPKVSSSIMIHRQPGTRRLAVAISNSANLASQIDEQTPCLSNDHGGMEESWTSYREHQLLSCTGTSYKLQVTTACHISVIKNTKLAHG